LWVISDFYPRFFEDFYRLKIIISNLYVDPDPLPLEAKSWIASYFLHFEVRMEFDQINI
jgi:hypothetical protein